MKISQAHERLIKIILTILSLASSLDLMFVLKIMIVRSKKMGDSHSPYISIIIYIILFLLLAISYWIKGIKHLRGIRNTIIIVTLGMTISSYLIAWPALIFMHSTVITIINEVLLAGTTILALMVNNLESFTSSSMVLLLFLKFISAAISLFYGAFILASLAVSGNAIVGMKAGMQNFVILIGFIFALWNVAYAVIIWLNIYRSWWSWLMTLILILEISVPLIWEATSLPNGSIWSSLMITVLIALITLIMTYLNNFLKRLESF